VSRYQKGKTNVDFTEPRDSEWQWHQLDHMQFCTSLQTDNDTGTPPLTFLQAGCPSCHPTNSIKALKAQASITVTNILTPTLQKFSQAKQSPDVSQKLRLLCLACEKCYKLALYDDSE